MRSKVCEIIFVLLLLIGIVVCTMCDIALLDTYTWSLLPISSIIFAWVALIPYKRYGKKGIWGSIVILNTCIISYLYAVSNIVKNHKIISTIGIKLSIISIIYILCMFILFKVLKKKKYKVIGFSLLIGVPMCIFINVRLSKMYRQTLIDIWDLLAALTIFILSVVFFMHELNSGKE